MVGCIGKGRMVDGIKGQRERKRGPELGCTVQHKQEKGIALLIFDCTVN